LEAYEGEIMATTVRKHYVGEVGTAVILDCGQDITSATNVSIAVKKPDGTKVTWVATVYNTRYLRHITITNDLDQSGLYELQSVLTLGSWTGRGETTNFVVFDNFA